MPGKYTEGYTKDAQKTKFIRHRDIKMKDGELKREAHIQKVMCEGVCRRCREKVQWRFRYDKYKPLKNMANCQGCKQKCVTKAYRTLCEKCAQNKVVCPGCCGTMEEPETEAADAEKASEHTEETSTSHSDIPTTVFCATQSSSSSTTKTVAPMVDVNDTSKNGEKMNEEDGVDENDEDNDEENENEEEEGEEMDESLLSRDIQNAPNWNEKKFKNIASSKYSKKRKVGSDSDVTYL